ncbi:MAG: MaoC family dehydratase N-terminal domain-containing protein [Alphaproteobacteria bacterium]
MSATDYAAWIGRERFDEDAIAPGPAARLSATLDRDDPAPVAGDPLPPAWHWLYFLAAPRAGLVSADGRGAEGDPLPPFPSLARMWAGGTFEFHRPLRVGETAHRRSRVLAIEPKQGRSGRLVFVAVEHRIAGEAGDAVTETVRIVFREPGPYAGSDRAEPAPATAAWRRVVRPDAVMLFRFSALTFNAHRIHYDRAYVVEEGYPGLLVHGPLTAILLLDLVRREAPGRSIARVDYRALRPLFVDAKLALNGAPTGPNAVLWAEDDKGRPAMRADVTFA